MIIVKKRAIEKLYELTKQVGDNPSVWKALRFQIILDDKYSRYDIPYFQITTKNFGQAFKDDSAYVFFLEHGVVYLVVKGAEQRDIDHAINQFTQIFSDITEDDIRVYDLFVDWELFCSGIQKKYDVFVEKSQDPKGIIVDGRVNTSVDMNYAKTILKERDSRKKLRVMLVEDDPFTLNLIANLLKSYELIKASDGFDAVEKYYLNAPDIVFLDIDLPTFDGHQVLVQIKKFDPNAYVVMLTGNSQVINLSKAVSEGAKGFVAKPFAKEKVLSHIKICENNKL